MTEKEIEAMVDQTSMELLLKEALSNLKVVGQDAMEAQQKAAAAIRAHVEQMKAALSQPQQDGMLKDLSDVLLNSQKFASDCVAAAKTAQVNIMGYNIWPNSSSTNQNGAMIIHHYLDFTQFVYLIRFVVMTILTGFGK